MRLGVWWLNGVAGIVCCIDFRCGGGVVLSVLWIGKGESDGVWCCVFWLACRVLIDFCRRWE